MAHLGPKQAAIFSPSVARAAASAQKDWDQVDGWLASRLGSQPSFERNPDTLRALLALVAANEAADEGRAALAAVERAALDEVVAFELELSQSRVGDGGVEGDVGLGAAREEILARIEEALPREGRGALEALASTAEALGVSAEADADAEAVGRRLADLQGEVFGLERAGERVRVLRDRVEAECGRVEGLLAELAGEEAYRPAPELARRNLEIQRRLKAAPAGPAGARRRVDGPGPGLGLTAEQVRAEEDEFLALLARRNELDARVRAFQGLPPDTDAARRELESLRDELVEVTRRRDAVFEGLVERETPRKPRR